MNLSLLKIGSLETEFDCLHPVKLALGKTSRMADQRAFSKSTVICLTEGSSRQESMGHILQNSFIIFGFSTGHQNEHHWHLFGTVFTMDECVKVSNWLNG